MAETANQVTIGLNYRSYPMTLRMEHLLVCYDTVNAKVGMRIFLRMSFH